jgi:tRNA A-37 threonylcarbamoyl transferase component Bud32
MAARAIAPRQRIVCSGRSEPTDAMTAEPDDLPAAPPGDDEPMPQIPGYRLLRVLGHGGMSTVYLAEQESLGRQVAVKVMLPEALADEVSRRRFENEARTVARLEHPHIVGIFEVGRTVDDLPYYAMPCLPRGHLGQRRFHEDPDGEATITAILRALLSALDYAHARGVVHRDVKAENVLFDDAGRPLLADFGIALRKGLGPRVTTAGLAVGSTAYMAPEQARGEEVDGRADLYSVGVLAWEMLTGQLPYMAGDALSMAVMHAQDPVPKLPPGLRHWQRFIDKAMAKSPGHRFRDAGQMLEALERIRQRRPVPGAAALRRLGRRIGPPQRWPRWAWGTLVLVAAAAVGLALRQAGPGEADFFRATPAAATARPCASCAPMRWPRWRRGSPMPPGASTAAAPRRWPARPATTAPTPPPSRACTPAPTPSCSRAIGFPATRPAQSLSAPATACSPPPRARSAAPTTAASPPPPAARPACAGSASRRCGSSPRAAGPRPASRRASPNRWSACPGRTRTPMPAGSASATATATGCPRPPNGRPCPASPPAARARWPNGCSRAAARAAASGSSPAVPGATPPARSRATPTAATTTSASAWSATCKLARPIIR